MEQLERQTWHLRITAFDITTKQLLTSEWQKHLLSRLLSFG